MRLFGVLIVLLFCTVLISFDQKSEEETLIYSYNHPETNQEFNIVHVYKLYDNYEKRIEKDSTTPKERIFEEEVIEPVVEACYQDAEYFERSGKTYSVEPPEDMELVNAIINTIDEEKINNAIKEALIESANYIPSNKATNVCIYPTPYDPDLPQMVTEGTGKISVLYTLFFDEEFLKVGIAHEYHHSVWTEKYFNRENSDTVLDILVLEGKAVMFENIVYPGNSYEDPSYPFLTEYWELVKPELNFYDAYRAYEIIYGGDDLPEDYGYNAGYHLVKAYLDSYTSLTPEEWTELSGEEIYEDGKYIEIY
ncbi:DUF2268 domain-containing putative Zn-dependent protease [Niallia sp. JL1B1071]|uniref:DUF2268 domain-containing putative Zn-dependent protease n=1 Tax=Niallia tiangongensis TaxID=3237105 RepID=UPI0037DCC0B2